MKTATAIGAALAVLSLTTVPALAAAQKYTVKGENASASFYQYDDNCSYTNVYVSAFNNITKSTPSAPTSQQGSYLSYDSYNYCTGAYSYGSGFSDTPTFTIANSLQSATLNGTYTVFDYYSGTSKTAVVDLTWTSTGNTYRGNSHSHYQRPGYISNYRTKSTSSEAQVTGSITIDGTNIIANLPSYGFLSSSNDGSLTVYKRN
ncbi:hypothetical protein WKK05_01170 [Nostoc sp. UHCC 0302]|uniref:hypothetical protein n=1 Tax=Nostoc sp. UHCC 0302 TaxID=3134896 RepID=UPI00311CD4FD